ncbi:chaplin [Actinacidiphila oryziradicis]|uniref:chaplin n=1 Tax=Actinacidiphila oryziradicis TaxID=2571141 RepID=UPI0023F12840|nr:chaplin [Actinacidiphila oryziradicis]MCW2873843.1 hypothetical protein [Actinacidiphila oryziradicis]
MRQVAKKGLLTAVATGGVLAVTTGGFAHADTGAKGLSASSSGLVSGNVVQVPIFTAVNACGNTVSLVGILNSAAGTVCVNSSHGGSGHGSGHGASHVSGHGSGHEAGHGGGSWHHGRGASAEAAGVLSGNVIQAPIDLRANACGNSVNVLGLGNSVANTTCVNSSDSGHGHEYPHHPHYPHHPEGPRHPGYPGHPGGGHPGHPAKPTHPGHRGNPDTSIKDEPVKHDPNGGGDPGPEVKESLAHTGAGDLGAALATSAGLLLGGAVLLRRARSVRN